MTRAGRGRAGCRTARRRPAGAPSSAKRNPSASVAASGQREGGNAGAEQQRRDRHMQPVQRAGGEKARDRDAAALDEDPPQPARRQRREHRRRYRSPLAARAAGAAPAPADAVSARRVLGAEQQRLAARRGKRGSAHRAGDRCRAPRAPATGPRPRRVVSCGSSARTVPAPMTTASHSARSRCVCTMSSLAADPLRGAENGGDAAVQRLGDAAEHEARRIGRIGQQRAVERRQIAVQPVPAQQAAPGLRGQRGMLAAVSRCRPVRRCRESGALGSCGQARSPAGRLQPGRHWRRSARVAGRRRGGSARATCPITRPCTAMARSSRRLFSCASVAQPGGDCSPASRFGASAPASAPRWPARRGTVDGARLPSSIAGGARQIQRGQRASSPRQRVGQTRRRRRSVRLASCLPVRPASCARSICREHRYGETEAAMRRHLLADLARPASAATRPRRRRRRTRVLRYRRFEHRRQHLAERHRLEILRGLPDLAACAGGRPVRGGQAGPR